MANHKHLTLQERYEIQYALDNKESFQHIGTNIEKDATTVAKEVKSHYVVMETGGYGRTFNPCLLRKDCGQTALCGSQKCRTKNCSSCKGCYFHCPDFQEEKCSRLEKPPYVCNGCEKRAACTLRKHLYRAVSAQSEYESLRSESREGIAVCPEEIRRIDDIISPLVKQGQSIHHICTNNADIIMLDEKTIYNYVDMGLLSVGNLDLPRKVRYRPRKKQKSVKLDRHCYEGRTYADFEKFMEDNPDMPVVEMDSVEGVKGGKVLLTMFFRNSSFMLAFLRDANTARSVTDIVNDLYDKLGPETYDNLFPVILTDRGSEFSNPKAIEADAERNRRSLVFYCDPNAPYQKGGIEVTHEFIRRVIPKGTSLNPFQQKDIDLMMDNINSYKRKKLNDRSANQLFSFFYGDDVLAKLNAHSIEANRIDLTPGLLKK